MSNIEQDICRYVKSGEIPRFWRYFRKCQDASNKPLKLFYRVLYHFSAQKNHIEISSSTKIGGDCTLDMHFVLQSIQQR